MSNLLSEAIVDAKALRDAALKNAETIVIEKYSTEVRDTLEKLLEQPEAPPPVELDADMGPDSEVPVGGEEAAMPPMEEPLDPMAETEEPAEEISEDDIPLGATNGFADLDGKNLGSFPADGQDVELNINLGALQESVDELTAALQEEEEYDISEENIAAMVAETLGAATKEELEEVELTVDDPASEQDADDKDMSKLANLAEEEEEDDPVYDKTGPWSKGGWGHKTDAEHAATAAKRRKTHPGGIPKGTDYDPKKEKPERYKGSDKRMRSRLGESETEAKNTDMDSLVDAVMERLTVDMGATLSGWAGRSSESMRWEIEKALAHRRSTDVDEELEDLKKAHEELVFENNQLTEHNNKYKQATVELKESLHDVNLSNARLLYTNRVLRNASLNERQKDKIVEAISGAGSVAEARTIYDTLQSTVEAAPKRSPQSLSEAIGRRSTVLRASRKEEPSSDPLQDRMKRLAGIK